MSHAVFLSQQWIIIIVFCALQMNTSNDFLQMDNCDWCLPVDAEWPKTEQFYNARAYRVDYFVASRVSVRGGGSPAAPHPPSPFILASSKSKVNAL